MKPPPRTRYDEAQRPTKRALAPVEIEADSKEENNSPDEDDEELSSLDGDLEDASTMSAEDDAVPSSQCADLSNNALENNTTIKSRIRKRKRQAIEDDIEGNYMLRIAKEEEQEEEARQAERRLKRKKLNAEQESGRLEEAEDTDEESEPMQEADRPKSTQPNGRPLDVPQHETLAQDKDEIELEKSSRTVFLSNVSVLAITDKKAKKKAKAEEVARLKKLSFKDIIVTGYL